MSKKNTYVKEKIIFLGTPDFAVPILEKLINNGCKPVAVFCAPDKPIGRKQIPTPPPTKILAQKYNILVFQPTNSHELANALKNIPCDLIITAAYGLILSKEILDAPKHGCLNVHPSLLPKYRGPSPIQTTIANGDTATGVTIYKMDEQIDHGPILITDHLSLISKRQTTPELSKELAELGVSLLFKILSGWLTDRLAPQPQDDSQATFTKIITKEDGQIDWQKSAKKIDQQIRAYTPWPGSFCKYFPINDQWQTLKIIEGEPTEKNYDKKMGEVFLTDTDDLAIQTGSGALLIKKLQIEGGKLLNASDFLRGHKNIIGTILN